VPARLDDLAQPAVHALDGVGGVDHAAHLGREGEERDDAIPGPAPGCRDGGVALPPGAALEVVQRLLCGLGAGGGVDGAQSGGQQLAVLPAGVVQAVTDQGKRLAEAS
jgi:hypothetical protein